jgi:hypothetical protein
MIPCYHILFFFKLHTLLLIRKDAKFPVIRAIRVPAPFVQKNVLVYNLVVWLISLKLEEM